MFTLQGSQKEKGIENVFDEIMTKNFPDPNKDQISRYRKHRGPQARWTQANSYQGIIKMPGVNREF